MMDIASQLEAITREVERKPATADAAERISVLMRRTYDTPIGGHGAFTKRSTQATVERWQTTARTRASRSRSWWRSRSPRWPGSSPSPFGSIAPTDGG